MVNQVEMCLILVANLFVVETGLFIIESVKCACNLHELEISDYLLDD